ncbi:TPA: hypothetical protein ACXIH6_003176 [Proteus mirabilis]|uniref:hypothetical protein n=1 Tax=Proteus mirabilis TaxID=584 RepID=UPI0018C4CFC4|nr:hypothetical protein [Proteus mirabilis]MBG2887044.1 hypothetical protein [Proteus mirabilis]HBC6376286.1 hypothetical protein [Proteus mirabilis]HEH1509476.1 hypothetical protein [Proteus mirabilis]HEJ9560541.1 hypothetical protein [Proteus mirabilis]
MRVTLLPTVKPNSLNHLFYMREKVGGSGISAVGIIDSKSGGRPVNIIGKGSQLPDGYSPKDNSVR